MIDEHSAGVIIFRQMPEFREYLLLHYPSGHFDFPKGHIEGVETEREAAYRELQEETGIAKIVWIEGYREVIQYSYKREGKMSVKEVVFFLARTTQKKVVISFEHKGAIWLPYPEAHEKLTYTSAKNLLKKAEKFLRQ